MRFYAAYNIGNPVLYDVCIWSYLIAGWHFVSEWLVFGSASYVCSAGVGEGVLTGGIGSGRG